MRKKEENVRGSCGWSFWKREENCGKSREMEEKGIKNAVEKSSGWNGSDVENPDAKVNRYTTMSPF